MIDGILEFPILPFYLAARKSRKIDGWLLNAESRFLFAAARLVQPPATIVEVGAWHGKSTVMLCAGSQAGRRVPIQSFDLFSIGGSEAEIYRNHGGGSPNDYLPIWKKNITRATGGGLASPVVGCSWENAAQVRTPIGLLFLDGDHTENGVRQDWAAFSPHLADNAIVMFHDYRNQNNPGVRKVVDEIRGGWNFGLVGNSAIIWRPVL